MDIRAVAADLLNGQTDAQRSIMIWNSLIAVLRMC